MVRGFKADLDYVNVLGNVFRLKLFRTLLLTRVCGVGPFGIHQQAFISMHCTHMDACANRASQPYQASTGDLFGKFLENYIKQHR